MSLKKSNSDPGYVWVPYVMSETVAVVSESFTPKQALRSRYSVRGFWTKQFKRKEKIKKILNKKDPQ